MSKDSDYADNLIVKYEVPDYPPRDWPRPPMDQRAAVLAAAADRLERLTFAVNELKCQRNDLLADIHKAEASAKRYRKYFLWCSGALGVLVAAGIGWGAWVWLWK